MQSFENYKRHHGSLLDTEKAQLYNEDNTTKLFITATYLDRHRIAEKQKTRKATDPITRLFSIFKPEFPQDKKENERFIVGIQLDTEMYDDFDSGSVTLTLNGKKALKIVPLSSDDARLKHIAFVSDWGNYFMVIFPPIKSEKLTLKFESDLYGTATLRFAKRARYVYTGKAFD